MIGKLFRDGRGLFCSNDRSLLVNPTHLWVTLETTSVVKSSAEFLFLLSAKQIPAGIIIHDLNGGTAVIGKPWKNQHGESEH